MIRDTILGIFVAGPWYSTFITAKHEYSTQNVFFVKSKFAGKHGQLLQSTINSYGVMKFTRKEPIYIGFYFL